MNAPLPAQVEDKVDDAFFGVPASRTERVALDSAAGLQARVHCAKALPLSAHQLLAAAMNPECTPSQLASILERDPALSVRVLRLVNAAGSGLAQPCTTVRHAATMLGITKLCEIASAVVVLGMFESESPHGRRIMDRSAAVATLTRRLAQRFDLRSGDAFTCALLHDVGQLMMLDEPGYTELLDAGDDQTDAMVSEERARFGFDHAVLAQTMLERWNIPAPIPQVVGLHHAPARVYTEAPLVATTVHLLRMAGAVYKLQQSTTATREDIERIARDESATALEITADDLVLLLEDLRHAKDDAVDPQPSADPVDDVEAASADSPSAVPEAACAECGVNTYGQCCPRCAKPVCQVHAPGGLRCCKECEEEYEAESRSPRARVERLLYRGAGISAALGVVFLVLQALSVSRFTATFQLCLAVLVALGGVFTVFGLWQRWKRRTRFMETVGRDSGATLSGAPPGSTVAQVGLADQDEAGLP